MEQVIYRLNWKTLLLYLDDMIVTSPDFNSLLQRLEYVFRWLQDAGLKLKPTKCELLQDKVHYLDHVVSVKGATTDLAKGEAIKRWEPLKDVKGLQLFQGTAAYYCQYLLDFATVAKSLTRLVSGDNSWTWNTEKQTAFQCLKDSLVFARCSDTPTPNYRTF